MSPLPSHTARCCVKQRSRLRYGKEKLTLRDQGSRVSALQLKRSQGRRTAVREEPAVGLFDSFLQPRRPSRPAIPHGDCSGFG